MKIDLRQAGGARKMWNDETEKGESGILSDPVYEEIERSARCSGGNLCPCNNEHQNQLQRERTVLQYQQPSDLCILWPVNCSGTATDSCRPTEAHPLIYRVLIRFEKRKKLKRKEINDQN